jgi:hypothetical protein
MSTNASASATASPCSRMPKFDHQKWPKNRYVRRISFERAARRVVQWLRALLPHSLPSVQRRQVTASGGEAAFPICPACDGHLKLTS